MSSTQNQRRQGRKEGTRNKKQRRMCAHLPEHQNCNQCYSHAFWETDSLRRTMQIVKCSLLRWWAQGRVSSQPRTPSSICENLLYPKCTCPNPPPKFLETYKGRVNTLTITPSSMCYVFKQLIINKPAVTFQPVNNR